MNAVIALYRNALHGVLRATAMLALYVAIVVLAVAVSATLTGVLGLKPLYASDPSSPGIGTILGVTGALAALIAGGLAITMLFAAPLTREQASGRIIAVVASPAGARRAWLARALALWTIGAAASVISAVVTVTVMRAVWAGSYPLTEVDGAYLVAMFGFVPLVVLGLALVVTAAGLAGGAGAGSVVANVSYIGASTTLGRLAGGGHGADWYAGCYLVLAIALLIAGALCTGLVTRERVVAACR